MNQQTMWFIGEALVAIGRNLTAAKQFDRVDLIAWCPAIAKRPRAASMALEQLHLRELIQPIALPTMRSRAHRGVQQYAITQTGMEASKAAYDESVRLARIDRAHVLGDKARASSLFAARLWALVRMRKALTVTEAAELLTDAGGNLARAKAKASLYLLTWATAFPDAMQVSAIRIRNNKRYVLVRDLGPGVPQVGINVTRTTRTGAA